MLNYVLKGRNDGDIIDVLFENRGILDKEIILNPNIKSVSNSLVYNNMKDGIELLNKNINNKILILVDSDTDGFSSAAEIYIGIKKINPKANISHIIHENKAHGLTSNIMEQVLEIKPDLLIIPDASSNDYEQHKILSDNNIKVLVIDHHECEKYSEYALVINNQLDENANKTLSGGGMVLKFFEAYDIVYGTNIADNILDLAALAMIGDSMLMTNEETRYYCKYGMFNPTNRFIRHNSGPNLSFADISWKIAPIINSVIRMGDMDTKHLLFEALIGNIKPMEIEKRGKGLVETDTLGYLDTMVSRYRGRQSTQVNKILNKGKVMDTKLCVIHFASDDFNRNLSGLVAGKLAEKYNKPALVLSKTETSYAGSARTLYNFDMRSKMENFESVEHATGHGPAFGLEFKFDNLDLFIKECNEHEPPQAEEYEVDRVYYNNINSQDIFNVLTFDKEWSKGFEKPIFAVELENIDIKNIDFYARNTVCIKTSNGLKMLKFCCSDDEIFKLNSMERMDITAIVNFEIDKYGKPCVSVMDWSIKEVLSTWDMESDLDDWWF